MGSRHPGCSSRRGRLKAPWPAGTESHRQPWLSGPCPGSGCPPLGSRPMPTPEPHSMFLVVAGVGLVPVLSKLQTQGQGRACPDRPGARPTQLFPLSRSCPRSEHLPAAPRSLPDGRELRKTKTEVSPFGQHQKARWLGGVRIKGGRGARETSRPLRSGFKDRVVEKALSSESQERGWAHSSGP